MKLMFLLVYALSFFPIISILVQLILFDKLDLDMIFMFFLILLLHYFSKEDMEKEKQNEFQYSN